MDYKIVVGRPPNFDAILKTFPLAERSHVVFAYDDTIYVSSELIVLSPALIDHECVHLKRQKAMGVEAWWKKYLTDPDFRYEEELLAHRAEFKTMVKRVKAGGVKPTAMLVAKKLAAPLYRFNKPITETFRDIVE